MNININKLKKLLNKILFYFIRANYANYSFNKINILNIIYYK